MNIRKTEELENLNYHNTSDIGVGSEGILRLPIFSGNWKNATFERYEYYFVSIDNDGYWGDYYLDMRHRFTIRIIKVIDGTTKKVGSVFWKQGKNIYGNYHELKTATIEALEDKHFRRKLKELEADEQRRLYC